MRRKLLTYLIFLALTPVAAEGQFFGPAKTVMSGTADPATCQPTGNNVFINRNSTPVLKICTAANTWVTVPTLHTGTTTNDNAPAGAVGEVLSTTVAFGSAVALTTNTNSNVATVSLTAGDWDCTGVVNFVFGATTSYTKLMIWISTTSAASNLTDAGVTFATPAVVPAADMSWATPTVRVSIAATTTTYMVARPTFTVSTLAAYGTIRCRRIR